MAWLWGYVGYEMPLELSLNHIANCLNLLTGCPLACLRSSLSTALSDAQYLTSLEQSTEHFSFDRSTTDGSYLYVTYTQVRINSFVKVGVPQSTS